MNRALFVICLVGCEADEATPCRGTDKAVVTDIDETLTTDDAEWLSQMFDADHDPAMRPDANTVMQTYADLGYTVFYVTARGTNIVVADGRSATEATRDWLEERGFPLRDDTLFLADGAAVMGEQAVAYKTETVLGLQDDGWTFAQAYGNATSDIEAFQNAGIPDGDIWLVGRLAGTIAGVNDLPDNQAYTPHLNGFVAEVPSACE